MLRTPTEKICMPYQRRSSQTKLAPVKYRKHRARVAVTRFMEPFADKYSYRQIDNTNMTITLGPCPLARCCPLSYSKSSETLVEICITRILGL